MAGTNGQSLGSKSFKSRFFSPLSGWHHLVILITPCQNPWCKRINRGKVKLRAREPFSSLSLVFSSSPGAKRKWKSRREGGEEKPTSNARFFYRFLPVINFVWIVACWHFLRGIILSANIFHRAVKNGSHTSSSFFLSFVEKRPNGFSAVIKPRWALFFFFVQERELTSSSSSNE